MNGMVLFIRFLAISLTLGFSAAVFGEGNETPLPPTGRIEETNTQETLRSYLQLQEQIHAIQLAIQQTRQQTDAAAAQSARNVGERLDAIDKALNAQRSRELDVVQSSSEAQQKSNDAQQRSNAVMLIVAGSFATIGFAALVLMAYFLWRTIQRLAELSAALPSIRAFNQRSTIAALGSSEASLVSVEPTEQASQRLAVAVDRLEKRICQMEHTAQPPLKDASPANHEFTVSTSPTNGRITTAPSNSEPAGFAPAAAAAAAGKDDPRVTLLLGKGKSMLNLNDVEGALGCFDEALALDPVNTEVLVKKGTALEKLRRLDEALECYDQAIGADGSMTIAYLHKGGLCNRMERFNEALECYEKALQTQEKKEA
jgi:tetratricopeptide (TPR) repeat protein